MECIPNFSEGRDITIVDAIVEAIRAVQGVRVLHRTSDTDHNRSVVTFIGQPTSVVEAAFAAVATAARLIDLDQHRGQHPRLGAADVVPLVPLKDLSLEECVVWSHQLGARIGSELGLPVYLYEASATRLYRRNLADVRRGEYEGLKENIHQPQRQPDYGLAQVGKAGAVIVGARNPLIAFNVTLNTDRVEIAQAVARQVRFSSGGLPGVKALGLLIKGQAQVSLNLTDYRQTSLAQVVEAIRAAADQHQVAIAHTELIGMLPQDAIVAVARYYLQLSDFDASRILESFFDSFNG